MRALLTVGCGSRYFSVAEKELCLYGAVLMDEATKPVEQVWR